MAELSNPLFARLWRRVSAVAERRGQDQHRSRLLAGLTGRVVEIGAGTGLNFKYYPDSVTEVVAVEPEVNLRADAERAAEDAGLAVRVVAALADDLPFDDASFDAGVVSLVLCSVPDQAKALSELRRVIRPGGELRFYEHVVAHTSFQRTVQRAADATFWPRLSAGCHLTRDTAAAIETAGFEIVTSERFPFSPLRIMPTIPHILGTARR